MSVQPRSAPALGLVRLVVCAALAVSSLTLVGPARPAAAAPGQFTVRTLPGGLSADRLTFTSDGTLWLIAYDTTPEGVVAEGGVRGGELIVEYHPATGAVVEHSDGGFYSEIAAGPDGNVWFTGRSRGSTGFLDPVSGQFTRLGASFLPPSPPVALVAGPDRMFLQFGSFFIPMTEDGYELDESVGLGPGSGYQISGATILDNGDIWVTAASFPTDGLAKVGVYRAGVDDRINLYRFSGSSIDGRDSPIVQGPDGKIWFVHASGIYRAGPNSVPGSTSEPLTVKRMGGYAGFGLLVGPDGNLWGLSEELVRISPAGAVSIFAHPQIDDPTDGDLHPGSGAIWMTQGRRLIRFELPPLRQCQGRTVTYDLNLAASRPYLDDVILGTAAANTIDAGPGNDVVCAGGGIDRVVGGSGNDTVDGGPGADTLRGGAGNDRLVGGTGRDTCDGGTGSDTQTGCEVRTAIP